MHYRVEDRHNKRLGQMIQDLIDRTEDWLFRAGARRFEESEITNAANSLRMLLEAEVVRREGEVGEAVEKTLDASALGPFGAYLRTGAKLALRGQNTSSRGFARNREVNLFEIGRQYNVLVKEPGLSPEKATQATAACFKVSKSTVLRGRKRVELLEPLLDEIHRLRNVLSRHGTT